MDAKEKFALEHEDAKRRIANTFSDTVALDAYAEGAHEWMIAIIEGIILAVIAILLTTPDPISKLTAIVLTVITGFFTVLGIAYLLFRSSSKFIEAKRARDRDEDAEDHLYRSSLAKLAEALGHN
jgi:hypothetical protein